MIKVFKMKLYEGMAEEYEKRHNALWQEMKDMIHFRRVHADPELCLVVDCPFPIHHGEKGKFRARLMGDISGGNNAGIRTVWFNPEGNENDRGVNVWREAKTLYEVYDIIKEENGI